MSKNRVHVDGDRLRVAVASTILSGDPVVVGAMGGGVAITDYDAGDGKASIDFRGVYDLSVKGVDNAGNVAVAVGDALFYVAGDTPKLSKKSSGVFFGYAMEAVTGGATATIEVRLTQGGAGGTGYYGSGVFVSTEQTATGSAQNVAHGFGSVPSQVVVVPTEFASNLSYDVAEGTHTTTNCVVTVTSGAKFKVIAYK